MKHTRLGLTTALALAASIASIGAPAAPAASSLDSQERTTLLSMREEEKLAHDVYVALAGTSGSEMFLRIAAAETRHGQALERALAAYGIPDPTDGLGAGVFATARFQDLYDDLVAGGSRSPAAAYEVGATIERQDIADLRAAIDRTDEPVLDRIYANLLAGSRSHLAAFERQLSPTATGPQERRRPQRGR